MTRAVLWGALALSAIVGAGWADEAKADKQSCAQYREAIVRMETDSVRPPGWFALDQHLRALYRQDCVLNPTRQAPAQYWYMADGKPTGAIAHDPVVYDRDASAKKYPDGIPDPPPEAAYATTPEINERCMERGLKEPGMCVMIENLRAACAKPVDSQARNHCKSILAKDQTPTMPPAGEDLPPIRVALDGGPYTLSPNCDALLGRLSGDPLLDSASTTERARWLGIMKSECPDFLDALKRRTGTDPDKDPSRFWPSVGELVFNGFAPPGTPSQSPASVNADPGWQRMCKDAEKHQQTCVERLKGIRSAAPPPVRSTFGQGSPNPDNQPDPLVTSSRDDRDRTSQSGAFAQCAALYGQVLNMCKATESVAQRTAARMPPPAPPKPATPPTQAAPPKPSGGDSRPPPQQAAPGMSPQCQQLVTNYVSAAQANDGQRALSGYNALKSAGGCGVLGKVDRGAPAVQSAPAATPAFPTRRATPNTDAYVQPCNADQAGCAQAMRQLEQGTSPAAQAALVMHAISTGLELGAALAGGMAATMPQSGSGGGGQYNARGNNTDMRSLAPAPIHNGVGQGSGARPPQQNNQSTITGTK
jgi:hypothetical protein